MTLKIERALFINSKLFGPSDNNILVTLKNGEISGDDLSKLPALKGVDLSYLGKIVDYDNSQCAQIIAKDGKEIGVYSLICRPCNVQNFTLNKSAPEVCVRKTGQIEEGEFGILVRLI